ncbi:MAG: DoxX family protein [Alphaproteobacteria bacterium]|nr:DoxX family protein [Alphaproteobacteria bacterium]
MKTNPFYDSWLFLMGQTEDHMGSGVGPLLVILFLVLAVGSIAIAYMNWRDDPNQRTPAHLATWFMRAMIGCMWFQGSIWKLPLPVPGGFKGWTTEMVQNAAFPIHGALVEAVYLPLLHIIDPIVYLTELSMATALLLGFMVRPLSVVGMLFVVHLWLGLYKHPAEWPWLYIFLIFVLGFFVINNAGRSLGADAWLARRPWGPFKGDGLIARIYRRVG